MSGDVCVDQLGSLVVSTSQDELSHGTLPRPPRPPVLSLSRKDAHFLDIFSPCLGCGVGMRMPKCVTHAKCGPDCLVEVR